MGLKIIKNKKALTLVLAILVFLIIPISFASEDIATNQSQGTVETLDSEISLLQEDSINVEDVDLQSNDEEMHIDASNSEIYVDSNNGKSNGTGDLNDPVNTISQGLNIVADGGTLYLNGSFSGEGNSNLTLNNNPKKITFEGIGEAIIDGNYSTSFAVVTLGTYTFKNIKFMNNCKNSTENQFGGVFENGEKGQLTFIDCIFENNGVYSVNRANGGVIDNSGTVNIIGCYFANNTAYVSNSSEYRKNAADGGAISNLGTLNIQNSVFKYNKALRNGGVIRTQDGASTYIRNSSFIGNMAAFHLSGGSFGGAIYSWDSSLVISDSIFKDNWVYDASGYGAQGGAISSDKGGGKIDIQRCQFINNTAGGIGTVNGQSIFIGSVTQSVNYCTIDTGIYSGSQSVNLDNNWWVSSNGDISRLIENLPSSVKISRFAQLKLSTDAFKIEKGDSIKIFVKLCWNGTENQTNITLIPLRHVTLDSNCGIFDKDNGDLINGSFETVLTLNDISNPIVSANVDNVIAKLDLSVVINVTILSAVADSIYDGEDALINITLNKNASGICFIDFGKYRYYSELFEGRSTAVIPNLPAGIYDVLIRYVGADINNSANTSLKLEVKDKLDSKMNVTYDIDNEKVLINVELVRNATGNLTIIVDGKQLINYQITKNSFSYKLDSLNAGKHTVDVLYSGDGSHAELSKSDTLKITLDTKITVESKVTRFASDYGAGERGGMLYVTLKDKKGNALSNKHLQIALNGKIYNVVSDKLGRAGVKVSLPIAKSYDYVVSFKGDDKYNAAALASVKLNVVKKSTKITSKSKTFKVKSSKIIKVTLKTIKNPYDGKTYLKKGKKLTLTIKGKKYVAKTNSKGIAKFTIKLNKKGKYSAKINFSGDNTYKSSKKTLKIIIK